MSMESEIENKVTVRPLWVKLLLGAIASVVFIAVLLVGITLYVEERVKAEIITAVNEQVVVPVKVKGEIDLSLIKFFPYASLTFHQVEIDDRLKKGNAKLLEVEELSFLCHVYSLFGEKIEIKKVMLRKGSLHLHVNERGQNNYDIFKPSTDKQPSELAVQIKSSEVRDVLFTMVDKTRNLNTALQLTKAELSGNFSDSFFDLDINGKLKVNKMRVGEEQFVEGKSLDARMLLMVDKAARRYTLKKGVLDIDGVEFMATGSLGSVKGGTKIDFHLKNKGEDMQQLFSLLPEAYRSNFAGADGTGAYEVNVDLTGISTKTENPKVRVNANLMNSELKFSKYNKFLKNVNASVQYELDSKGTDKLVISNFNCTLNDQPFRFSLALNNLSNPEFDFNADGALYLTEVATFIPDSILRDLEGRVIFSDFRLKGKKSDFTNTDQSTLNGSGNFELSEVEFRQGDVTYGNINGFLTYREQLIAARDFTINFLYTDINFSGTVRHLAAFVYNLVSKRKANDVVLDINGKIAINTFNLSGMLEAYSKKNSGASAPKGKIEVAEVMNMSGRVELNIGRFLYEQMNFEDVKSDLQLYPGRLTINKLSARAMGGVINAMGNIGFSENLDLNCRVSTNALEVSEIFRQCDNFGQATLTNKNLKGVLSADVSFAARWNKYKTLDEPSLSALVDFNIAQGELIGFEPLKAASKFIKVQELERIRFQDLKNTIRIAERRLDVPEFEIKSSALNLILFGRHYFSNDVDYHFKINLHKLLANKFQRNVQNENFIEEDPYQGLNIFLSMSGNLSNPVIKYDKANTRNKIKEDFKREREVMKALLSNKTLPKDENESKREDKFFDTNEQPGFIEFEDDPK